MKTNFKKLALMAGVSAAMAGGSMSAHAVIQAVPAPAALIPLFNGCVNNSNNSQINGGLTNYVRIETPSSVGVDSIVNLFGGPNGNASTGAIPASGVATGLATSTPSNSTVATSRLHWYFMSPNSDEIINSAFPVSANDVIEFTNCAMPTTQISSAGSMTTVAVGSQSSGYLVIINDSAALGGAPLFSFQADSYRVNTAGLNSSTVYENIPVYPLTDTADNGAGAPTLANNVIEDVSGIAGGAPFGTGPVVSPLMSGIRLGATNASGAPYGWYRVIDFPVINGNDTYVVWADRNSTTNVVNGTIQTTPAIYGTTLTYDCNENVLSTGPLSFVDQLNFLTVGTTNSTAQTSTVANFDAYSNLFQPIGATTAQSTGCNIAVSGIPTALTGTNTSSGFVRYFAQSNPYTGDLTGAAYQASVIFRLRNSASEATYQFPVDRGFFTAK